MTPYEKLTLYNYAGSRLPLNREKKFSEKWNNIKYGGVENNIRTRTAIKHKEVDMKL
jgi:hypothetical protein